MTSDQVTAAMPIILVCRKCGREVQWGELACKSCSTEVVCGIPLVVDFPIGLVFGVVFNVVKLVVVMVISLGFLMSIPGRWYYPVYPRRARIRIRPRGSSEATDFEVSTSDWRHRKAPDVTAEYIVQTLYVNDRAKLLAAMKKQSDIDPTWAASASPFISTLAAQIPAKK